MQRSMTFRAAKYVSQKLCALVIYQCITSGRLYKRYPFNDSTAAESMSWVMVLALVSSAPLLTVCLSLFGNLFRVRISKLGLVSA